MPSARYCISCTSCCRIDFYVTAQMSMVHNQGGLIMPAAGTTASLEQSARVTCCHAGTTRQQERKEALITYSEGVLEALAANVNDAAAGPPESDEMLHVAYEAGLWELLHLFFLSDEATEGFFAEAFASWFGQHGGLFNSNPGFNKLLAEARRMLQMQRVDTDPAYWPTLQHLVLTGQVEAALDLLTQHPAYDALQDPDMAAKVAALESVYQLLRVVPRYTRAGGSSSGRLAGTGTLTDDVVLFSQERAAWRQRVDELWEGREQLLADLKKLDAQAARGLAGILCLLVAGSDKEHHVYTSFQFMAQLSHNWVELLLGMLLWKYPTLQPQLHLRNLVTKVKAVPALCTRQSDEEFLDFFEQLVIAACDQEVQSVASLCTTTPYCSLQFVTHIYDVLRALPGADRIISRPLPHLGGDQAEMYTLNYAESLAGSAATWQLAAEYLAWCPVHGAPVLEILLDRSLFVVQDEQSALKALALAHRHGLTAAAHGLARRLGMAAAQSGRLGVALQWMMRAHDPAHCAELVSPLIAKVQQAMLDQAGNYQLTPLELPELYDLEPLLLQLPAQISTTGMGLSTPKQYEGVQSRAYQELHFLHAFMRLQQALQEVLQLQQSASSGAERQPNQQQQALAAAYAGVREPVVDLLLDGLAPAALRLPLLSYIVPVFESMYMPFSRMDVQQMLQMLGSVTGGLPALASAVLAGTHTAALGLRWPAVAEAAAPDGADAADRLQSQHVNDVQLALCRSLAKAHVVEASLKAVA
eukprot:GHRR01020947.1.p1 GENE.GHRR01020947.1~~GHRR01020947.1.p1  ORF type:complete len:757 (+),score=295.89 GHRR01020947.1:835-3105(+)